MSKEILWYYITKKIPPYYNKTNKTLLMLWILKLLSKDSLEKKVLQGQVDLCKQVLEI